MRMRVFEPFVQWVEDLVITLEPHLSVAVERLSYLLVRVDSLCLFVTK